MAVGWEVLAECRAEFEESVLKDTPFTFTVGALDRESLGSLYNRGADETIRLLAIYVNQTVRNYHDDLPYRVERVLHEPGTDKYHCFIRRKKVVQK